MTMIYPNIVPENNLRLPDALTIKHGPAPLLAKFVLEGDKLARRRGIRLRLRYDFGELLYVNKQRVGHGDWFRLINMFNPEYSDLIPENSYWLSGEDEHGEIVLTQAGRIYYFPDTNLEQEAHDMFYTGHGEDQKCLVTAKDAKAITGVVFYGGSGWVRPDFRGRQLMRIIPRLGRAYALARWPVDWGVSFVAPVLVDKGVAAGYGYKHASYSINYPESPWGDLEVVLVSVSAKEAYADFTTCLTGWESRDKGFEPPFWSSGIENRVTRAPAAEVLQGSSSLS